MILWHYAISFGSKSVLSPWVKEKEGIEWFDKARKNNK